MFKNRVHSKVVTQITQVSVMNNNNDIHKELMDKLDELTARLSDIEKDTHHKDAPVSADFAEQATESEMMKYLRRWKMKPMQPLRISRIP